MAPAKPKASTVKADPNYQAVPPRIIYNKLLLDAFLAQRKIVSQWPPVVEQAECIIVQGLFPGGYNPSLIRFHGQLLMAYRFHRGTKYGGYLAIAELDEQFRVTGNHELVIQDEKKAHEDPRLFEFQGRLCMSYVSCALPTFHCLIKYVELSKPDRWLASAPVEHPYIVRNPREKNHVPFPVGDRLHLIYRENPQQIIFTAGERGDLVTPALRWPYGEIRGGTTPMAYHGKLLKFFHSSLRNEMPPLTWRYYVGAMLMEPEPPFQMLAVSKRPILRASELGGDNRVIHFNKNGVFPLGCVEKDGVFHLSIGINNSQSAIAKIKPEDLHL